MSICQDNYSSTFPDFPAMLGYHENQTKESQWERRRVKDLRLEPLDTNAPLYTNQSYFAPGISREAIEDTAKNLGLAMKMDSQFPIHIGECVAVDHRKGHKVSDFETALDQVFAQFGDLVGKLQRLLEVELDYPINAMTRACKKLSLPKKAAVEAIAMYGMALGGSTATAHDVYFAMQEIPFILKTQGVPESKILSVVSHSHVEPQLQLIVHRNRIVSPVHSFMVGTALALQDARLAARLDETPVEVRQGIGVPGVLVKIGVVGNGVPGLFAEPVGCHRFQQVPHLQLSGVSTLGRLELAFLDFPELQRQSTPFAKS